MPSIKARARNFAVDLIAPSAEFVRGNMPKFGGFDRTDSRDTNHITNQGN